MDFTRFDNRAPAEAGVVHQLANPVTREPLFDSEGNPCNVIIRAVSSPSLQAEMRKRQKAAMLRKGSAKEQQDLVVEDSHISMCNNAMPYVLGFENIGLPNADGKVVPLTTSQEDLMRFFDLTFPLFGVPADKRNDPSAQIELLNFPFATQVVQAASEAAERLGN